MAGCCGDDVVASVLPFVQGNITNENWKYRDAAIMAFGSILEGPSQKALEPIVIKVNKIIHMNIVSYLLLLLLLLLLGNAAVD